MKKIIGFIYVFIGIGLLGLWLMLLVTNNVPEVETEPSAIIFHITIEIIMGILSLITGFLLLKSHSFARSFFFVTSGMLFYSIVNSAGYYVELANMPMIFMFTVLFVLVIVSIYIMIKEI